MNEGRPFFASSVYLFCIFALAFLFLIWPFPTIFESSEPIVLFRYLFIAWGGCIACVGIWAASSARYAKLRMQKQLEESGRAAEKRFGENI